MSVSYLERGRVAIIRIEKPKDGNPVDLQTARDLHAAMEKFDRSTTAMVGIIAGKGDAFCVGAQLDAFKGARDRQKYAVSLDEFGPLSPTYRRLRKPVIGAVEGCAAGAGLELALWCNILVAADDAVFTIRDHLSGKPLATRDGTDELPRMLKNDTYRDLFLSGRDVEAMQAKVAGFVHYLAEPGKALEEALKLARKMTSLPEKTLQNIWAEAQAFLALSEEEAFLMKRRLGLEGSLNEEWLKKANLESERAREAWFIPNRNNTPRPPGGGSGPAGPGTGPS